MLVRPVPLVLLRGSMPIGRFGRQGGARYVARTIGGSRYDRAAMPDLEREELIQPLERALVIFSHPDDAEFGAASDDCPLTARGTRVDYVVTTDGGKGTEDPAVTPAQLIATRGRRAARRG